MQDYESYDTGDFVSVITMVNDTECFSFGIVAESTKLPSTR